MALPAMVCFLDFGYSSDFDDPDARLEEEFSRSMVRTRPFDGGHNLTRTQSSGDFSELDNEPFAPSTQPRRHLSTGELRLDPTQLVFSASASTHSTPSTTRFIKRQMPTSIERKIKPSSGLREIVQNIYDTQFSEILGSPLAKNFQTAEIEYSLALLIALKQECSEMMSMGLPDYSYEREVIRSLVSEGNILESKQRRIELLGFSKSELEELLILCDVQRDHAEHYIELFKEKSDLDSVLNRMRYQKNIERIDREVMILNSKIKSLDDSLKLNLTDYSNEILISVAKKIKVFSILYNFLKKDFVISPYSYAWERSPQIQDKNVKYVVDFLFEHWSPECLVTEIFGKKLFVLLADISRLDVFSNSRDDVFSAHPVMYAWLEKAVSEILTSVQEYNPIRVYTWLNSFENILEQSDFIRPFYKKIKEEAKKLDGIIHGLCFSQKMKGYRDSFNYFYPSASILKNFVMTVSQNKRIRPTENSKRMMRASFIFWSRQSAINLVPDDVKTLLRTHPDCIDITRKILSWYKKSPSNPSLRIRSDPQSIFLAYEEALIEAFGWYENLSQEDKSEIKDDPYDVLKACDNWTYKLYPWYSMLLLQKKIAVGSAQKLIEAAYESALRRSEYWYAQQTDEVKSSFGNDAFSILEAYELFTWYDGLDQARKQIIHRDINSIRETYKMELFYQSISTEERDKGGSDPQLFLVAYSEWKARNPNLLRNECMT